jgi:hypothetical protein
MFISVHISFILTVHIFIHGSDFSLPFIKIKIFISQPSQHKKISIKTTLYILYENPFRCTENWTQHMLGTCSATWAMPPALLFVFWAWNMVSLTFPGLNSKSQSSCLLLSCSWNYRWLPPCLSLYKIFLENEIVICLRFSIPTALQQGEGSNY